MRVDLHIHTTASDGCWPPERLIVELQARSIGLFAVADHDTVANVAPTERLACEAGLDFLRGVEISTRLDGTIFHVLGYGFIVTPALSLLLDANVRALARGDLRVVRQLAADGCPVDPEEYAGYRHEDIRGGWKLLSYLVDRGLCSDVWDYLHNLLPSLSIEAPLLPHPREAIAAIRAAGGVPVLAHPGGSLRDLGLSGPTLRPFLDLGIAGLECYSQYHDDAATRFCLEWCERHDMLVTGGSDCHGGFVGRELGLPLVDTSDLRLGVLDDRVIRCCEEA